MSAPRPVLPATISTSGYRDGLGRRSLAFDRECGIGLECLSVRPEFVAFERTLRERADRLAALDDERFARVRSIETGPGPTALTVTSEFVAGNRLCDVIGDAAERARDENTPPSVDAALGFLLQALPALAALHAARLVHGAIAPSRMVLTPAGQVVFVDSIFAEPLQRLYLSRQRLWTEFDLAVPASAGHARMDAALDISQCALAALAITVGRPIRRDDFPAGLTAVLAEAVEIAQLRGSAGFASALQRFFARALPLPVRRPFASAEDAASAVQQLVRDEIGVERCRAALVDLAKDPFIPAPEVELPCSIPGEERVVTEESVDVPAAAAAIEDSPAPILAAAPLVLPRPDETPVVVEDTLTASEPAVRQAPVPLTEAVAEASIDVQIAAPIETPIEVPIQSPIERPTEAPVQLPVETPAAAPVRHQEPKGARRKRQRPGKGHRDGLRSADVKPVVAAPDPAPPRPAPPAPPLPPPPPSAPPIVAVPRFEPLPAPPVAPILPPPPVPTYNHVPDHAWTPPPTAVPLAPLAAPALAAPPAAAPLRLKAEPPAGFVPPASTRTRAPLAAVSSVDRPVFAERDARRPGGWWKYAAAAAIVAAIGITAGRAYLPDRIPEAIKNPVPPAAAAPVAAAVEKTGTLVVETQPEGANVSIDGKPAGETPLKLDGIAVGHHIVTLSTASATVKRSVRIEAGKTSSIDVGVYSGWLAIFAPFILEIAEQGRSLGTTEHGRLMLSPGRHSLTLSNKELGYKAVHKVDIEPGEERVLTIEPRGAINVNAQPWAEVFIDGQRAGETPIANLPVLLGTREIVFKHPQYGERRTTIVVTALEPATVTVDFTKSQF